MGNPKKSRRIVALQKEWMILSVWTYRGNQKRGGNKKQSKIVRNKRPVRDESDAALICAHASCLLPRRKRRRKYTMRITDPAKTSSVIHFYRQEGNTPPHRPKNTR